MKTLKLKSILLGFVAFCATILVITSCEQETVAIPDEVQDSSADGILSRQSHIGGLGVFDPVTAQEAANLTVFVDPCFIGTDYEDAIPAALETYNASPTSLHYTIVTNISDADMVFKCFDGTNCGQGYASPPVEDNAQGYPVTTFPSGGVIGKEVHLATSWSSCPCTPAELDQCFFEHKVLHEMTHTLGFVHNDEQFFTFVEGTSPENYDSGSVMNSGSSDQSNGVLCSPPCDFNANDILALQDLYPEASCPTPTISDITFTIQSTRVYVYAHPYSGTTHQFRYRVNGGSWTTFNATTSHFNTINNPEECSTYDVQLRQKCGSEWSDWSSSRTFTSQPARPSIGDLYSVSGGCTYAYPTCYYHNGDRKQFQLRKASNNTVVGYKYTTGYVVTYTGLTPSTQYKYRVRKKCGTTGSYGSWSPYKWFWTPGC